MICLLVVLGVAVSMTVLGSSLGRFSARDACTIPLVPPAAEASASSADSEAATSDATDSSAQSRAVTTATIPAASSNTAVSGNADASASSAAGDKLDVVDDAQVWSNETQVDLFKGSYDGMVVSADGDKLLAPGTDSSYSFTLRNNADTPMDYEVALKVDTWSEGRSADEASAIPMEWRLLDANGAPVSDWQLRSNEEVLDSATLSAGRQARYAIEWRWAYDQDAPADAVDTAHGNRAAREDFGATATILVRAEQATDLARPDDLAAANNPAGVNDPAAATKDSAGDPSSDASASPKTPWDIVAGWLPQTGDAALATLAAGLAGTAALALIVLLVAVRRRRKEDAGDARP
ncbi:LPXTG cell wall anchor domain-containing protein [Adlercreutzia sp. ZJ242]|uniref:LPXTG cell wall anchor domain-containing protein n=1 Tax=Adlercreutzia sp. ZJ242 TaxID=2709409 RepID=UPI0013EBBE51|nr:LPXTG cell wall anchor domain-containing protein [Adlercreutzia sp. ZJ242]